MSDIALERERVRDAVLVEELPRDGPLHRPASPEGARNGRKPNTPTATRKPGTSLWEFCDQADQLVARFEQPVVERQKAAYAAKGQTW